MTKELVENRKCKSRTCTINVAMSHNGTIYVAVDLKSTSFKEYHVCIVYESRSVTTFMLCEYSCMSCAFPLVRSTIMTRSPV